MKTSLFVGKTLEKLKKRKGVSGYEFSREWLNKTPGYLAYTKSSGAEPSFECLKHIRKKALKEHKSWIRYIEKNKGKQPIHYLERIEDTANFYRKIAEEAEKELLN